MNWKKLESEVDLEQAIVESNSKTVAIFKHSTRCSVSLMAKKSLEMDWNLEESEVVPYFLDLLSYRSISTLIAEKLEVQHESPQMIGLRNGEVFYHASHGSISVNSLKSAISY